LFHFTANKRENHAMNNAPVAIRVGMRPGTKVGMRPGFKVGMRPGTKVGMRPGSFGG
jgi:hypothetical protein